MTIRNAFRYRALAAILMTAGVGTSVFTDFASGEDMSTQQIVRGLTSSTSRSLSVQQPSGPSAPSPADEAFVKKMQTQGRGLSLGDREQMAAIATKRPKIDLNINFDFNSATLSRTADSQLKALGDALTSKELAGGVFMLGGHTDAKGSDSYNQTLSQRRADSVKRFLIDTYRVPAANLVTAGYGEKMLKNPADGFAAENRRVEVVNMTTAEQASK